MDYSYAFRAGGLYLSIRLKESDLWLIIEQHLKSMN